ncbi:unnamed protein product [Rotaria sordida]|uniref:Uncharacterized protein n=1 Tax=Rotaria sordida TaxID=392033 RepID=A0A819P6J0_9BILA|nr:unnamed protein product [Rotaria sordida]
MDFNLNHLKIKDQCHIMEIDEKSSFEIHPINNNIVLIDQILSQPQIINNSLQRSPYITLHNKDQPVKLKPRTEYSVQTI